MPRAGVAGRGASVGPAWVAGAPTRSSQAPKTVIMGPSGAGEGLWWPKRRGQASYRMRQGRLGLGVVKLKAAGYIVDVFCFRVDVGGGG